MKIKEFVDLHRTWGYKISEYRGTYFHYRRTQQHPIPINSSFPPNNVISVDRKMVRALRHRYLVSSILVDAPRKDIYEFLLTTDNYGLEGFDRKVRNRIRKSLNSCEFRRPELKDLLSDGLRLNRQTCGRQGRKDDFLTDQEKWSAYITSIHSNENFHILGAYYEGKLNGYLIIYRLEGMFNLLRAMIDRTHSSSTNPMMGLLYTLINELVDRYGKITVSYGLHRFRGPTSLNNFKRNMQFSLYAASKCHVIHPALLAVIRIVLFYTLKVRKIRNPQSKMIRSFIQLYQGHRKLKYILAQQERTYQQPLRPLKVDTDGGYKAQVRWLSSLTA